MRQLLWMLIVEECFVLPVASTQRAWKTLHMDSSESALGGPTDCELVRPIRNDDMEAGDYYIVQSDSWHGRADPWHGTSHLARRPAECALAFNFGDRMASVTIEEWWCHLDGSHDPFLAIYNDCDGHRNNLLVVLNCSTDDNQLVAIQPIVSPSCCVTLYHFRGRVRSGYFFTVHVSADRELMELPAGLIAGIILSTVVVIMVCAKVACVVANRYRLYSSAATGDGGSDTDEQRDMLADDLPRHADDIRALASSGKQKMDWEPSGNTSVKSVSATHVEDDIVMYAQSPRASRTLNVPTQPAPRPTDPTTSSRGFDETLVGSRAGDSRCWHQHQAVQTWEKHTSSTSTHGGQSSSQCPHYPLWD